MRKLTTFLCLLLVSLIPLGCSPAKKPAPAPEPKTIVVPDVSSISFKTIDYDQAPEIVRAMAKNLKDSNFATWTNVNGTNYVVISQASLPIGSSVKITDIQRRVPANDFDWVNVKLKYTPSTATGQKSQSSKPIVATFTLDRTIRAISFEVERDKSAGTGAAPTTPRATSPAQHKVTPNQQPAAKGLQLTSPRAGEPVKSPLQVSGTAKGITGTVRIRVKNAGGLTLVEKPVQVVNGSFNTMVSFTMPTAEEKGTVEAFITGNSAVEKEVVSVPVTLLPGTIGAP